MRVKDLQSTLSKMDQDMDAMLRNWRNRAVPQVGIRRATVVRNIDPFYRDLINNDAYFDGGHMYETEEDVCRVATLCRGGRAVPTSVALIEWVFYLCIFSTVTRETRHGMKIGRLLSLLDNIDPELDVMRRAGTHGVVDQDAPQTAFVCKDGPQDGDGFRILCRAEDDMVALGFYGGHSVTVLRPALLF